MTEHMTFPKTAYDFIKQYSFKDEKQEYTNGAELISVFRVKQMMEHYFPEEVVRCKDCIHFDQEKALRPGSIWCEYWGTDPDPDDFCSHGERKDNDI